MNSTDRTDRRTTPVSRLFRADRLAFAGCFLAFAALGFVFVSDQSFWLDEVRSAAKAVQPTFVAFRAKLLQMGGTEVQSPLHIGLLWLWGRLAGISEWTLRALNLFFLGAALAIVASERTLSRPIRLWWGLLCAFSPLVAFYLDEVRPWMLVFAGGTAVAAALATSNGRDFPSRTQTHRLLGGIVILSAASLTGAVFAAWTGLWFLFEALRKKKLRPVLRRQPIALAASAIVLALLAAYYLWTALAGFQGTRTNPTTLFSTGFCLYEFLGFSGIGPARTALRADWIGSVASSLPAIGTVAAIWTCLAVAVRRSGDIPMRRIAVHPLLVCPILGALSLLVAGVVAHERILARHLIAALPAFLLSVAWLADRVWRAGRRLGRAAVFALCAAWLVSSLSLRFNPRHAKDDVRTAARVARDAAAAGTVVWWGGDKWTFEYYPPPVGEAASRLLPFPDSATIPPDFPVPRPGLAVLSSKYDFSDPDGSRRRLLRALGLSPSASLPGFALWTPSTPGP